jgi:hypothetical protein
MPRYIWQHNYRAGIMSRWVGVTGEEVDMPEADAEYINRDSPGSLCLKDITPSAPSTPAEVNTPPAGATPDANKEGSQTPTTTTTPPPSDCSTDSSPQRRLQSPDHSHSRHSQTDNSPSTPES